MGSTHTGRALKTTEKSLEILEFIDENNGATMAEAAENFGFTKSTTHGHLSTLLKSRYVIKRGERYRLGMKLLKLGGAARKRDKSYGYIRDELGNLVEKTNEGVDFSVLEHGYLITVFNEVDNPNDPNFFMGKHFYPHTTAAGKAILAEYSNDEAIEIATQTGFVQLTENTITDRDTLSRALDEIRDRGYAENNAEFQEGLRAVGAVIKNPRGDIVGGLSVGGPSYRVKGDVLKEYLPTQLLQSVEKIENEIEVNGPFE